MFGKKQDRNPDDFWREYEEKMNEKVLARGLGRYSSGWEEFDSKEWKDLWGLLIISSGGFRFHHFPQQNWLQALTVHGNAEGSREKIIFIPKEIIISAEILEEKRWWAKILTTCPPVLIINYRGQTGGEKKLCLKAEFGFRELAEKLCELRS